MRSACVIDNSTLVNLTKLYHLSIFSHLQNLFHTVHIPIKIKEEYENPMAIANEPVRRLVLAQMKLGSGFLAICSRYDLISLNFLRTTRGIDFGEAEVAAQHMRVNSSYVLSDDRDFIEGLQKVNRHIKTIGTLHLVAWLDCIKLIEPKDYLQKIYEHGPFKSYQLRAAYTEVSSKLSISISKKELSRKSSLKTLGLTGLSKNAR